MQADKPSSSISAMDSSQRVAMLRKRLDEYNSAISKAMGHHGAAGTTAGIHTNTNNNQTIYDDEDEDTFIDESTLEEEVWDSIHKRSATCEGKYSERQMNENVALRRFMDAQNLTASRSLFPDTYRDNSSQLPPSHDLPQFDEETEEDEDDDVFTDDEEDAECSDVGGREWCYRDEAGGPAAVGVRPTTTNTGKVERCLSSELREVAASIARSLPKPDRAPSFSSMDRGTLGDTVLLANTAIASSVTSPSPNVPVYSITDLENAFYRLQTVEQSLKHLSSFTEQDPKLPFADRLVQLHKQREELLVKDSLMRKKNSLQDASLVQIANSDSELHTMIQDLIGQCDSAHSSFVPIYARKAVIVQREELLRSKTQEMRKLYDLMQSKKRHVQHLYGSNKEATVSLASRKVMLVKERELVKAIEAANAEKTSKVADTDNRVKNWVAVLEERDRGLKAKERKMQDITTELKKRMDTVESQKENQIIAHQTIIKRENQSTTQAKGGVDQLLREVPWFKNDS